MKRVAALLLACVSLAAKGLVLGLPRERHVTGFADPAFRFSMNFIGAPALTAYWKDPAFNATERALYYVRVIQIPSPRWTAYDAARFGLTLPPEVPLKHQERAWASPIWYTPTN